MIHTQKHHLERFPFSCIVLSVGEASLARRAKQAILQWIADAAQQSQAMLQPDQDVTTEANIYKRRKKINLRKLAPPALPATSPLVKRTARGVASCRPVACFT